MLLRYYSILAAACLALLAGQPSADEKDASTGSALSTPSPEHVELPAWFKTSFLDLREDVKEATANNKRIMLMFHQEGCPFCAKLIKQTLSNPEVEKAFRSRFEAIELNIWGTREVTDMLGNASTEKEYAIRNKIWGTPTLIFLDEQGQPVARASGFVPPDNFMKMLENAGSASANP